MQLLVYTGTGVFTSGSLYGYAVGYFQVMRIYINQLS